jgi:hypothetical protein
MQLTDFKVNINKITTNDDITGLIETEETILYINIEKSLEYNIHRKKRPAELMWEIKFYLSDIREHHFREVYTFMDALGDIGG